MFTGQVLGQPNKKLEYLVKDWHLIQGGGEGEAQKKTKSELNPSLMSHKAQDIPPAFRTTLLHEIFATR